MAALEGLSEVSQASDAGFANAAGAWTFLRESPYDAKSRRERQCESEGVRVWRLLYRRR